MKIKQSKSKTKTTKFKDFNGVLRSETIRARREHDRAKIKELERNN
jgi:hypothetical protein